MKYLTFAKKPMGGQKSLPNLTADIEICKKNKKNTHNTDCASLNSATEWPE